MKNNPWKKDLPRLRRPAVKTEGLQMKIICQQEKGTTHPVGWKPLTLENEFKKPKF
jgi:hypothetical protein